ncbi:cytochrome c4 [Rhodanobacter denitrificans]|uniref:Cytochrome c4 n=1 Tax=Rhodanobacter denitrificans TaxID=666685 RepID=A0A368KDQ1_9GAMM|nr:cytochrome c4 [Rhodanobacter denitrificans]
MSFRSAGFRPAVLGSAIALAFALSSAALMAQESQPNTAAPAAASTAAAAPAASATAAPASAPVKPGDATAGQAKAAVCGACHGMDGNSSDAQYPKLAGQSEQYIVHQLTSFKAGKRQNPIMMGMAAPLSEQDMHDVGAYFASKTPLPGVADQALVERGQTLFRQGDATRGIPACMACHSIDGSGNPGAAYPHLASQHAQYIQATLKAWHDGTSWGDDARAQIMPAIAKQLTTDDIAALASYVEGLHSAGTQPAATP